METLDKHFRKLADAAFKKHGFATADLLSHWPEIAGSDLAGLCQPERIRWPRTSATDGGTLILRAAAGRGLDVQYAASTLIERINAYFGHRAIGKVKVQAGGGLPAAKPAATAIAPADLSPRLAGIADPVLKEALARLGSGVLAEKSRSPQAK